MKFHKNCVDMCCSWLTVSNVLVISTRQLILALGSAEITTLKGLVILSGRKVGELGWKPSRGRIFGETPARDKSAAVGRPSLR